MTHQHLPVEIAIDIFSRLPADSVLQCKLVCKAWRALINTEDPDFVDKHTRRYHKQEKPSSTSSIFLTSDNDQRLSLRFGDFDDEHQCFKLYTPTGVPTVTGNNTHHHFREYFMDQFLNERINNYNYRDIVGSCNGLVCLYTTSEWDGMRFDIFNLFTGEYVHLPSLNIKSSFVPYGFGFHPSTNEYKVVVVYYRVNDEQQQIAELLVYTLGSGRWRSMGAISDEIWFPMCSYCHYGGTILVDGVLHWNLNSRIIAFNLADEKFSIIPAPPQWRQSKGPSMIGVCESRLCLFKEILGGFVVWVREKKSWVMKPSTTSVKSWSYPLSDTPYVPLGILSSGKYLFLRRHEIISYDQRSGKSVIARFPSFNGCQWLQVCGYVKSFVSLKALGESSAILIKQ